MNFIGMFLLLAGWGIVLCAIVLFPRALPRSGFVLVGVGVEALGLALTFRGHSQCGPGDE